VCDNLSTLRTGCWQCSTVLQALKCATQQEFNSNSGVRYIIKKPPGIGGFFI
jgi:hypothetical protein